MSKKKYAVHPDRIVSKTDGQMHFISAYQLMKLYGVQPTECVVCSDKHPNMGIHNNDYIHLTPRHDGDYSIESAIKRQRK